MTITTLFDATYVKRKQAFLKQACDVLRPVYTKEELEALRVDPVNPAILSQRSGRGFVNRDILETVLGNLLECVAPGSHNALDPNDQSPGLEKIVEEVADQLYAMIAQSLLAALDDEDLEDKALAATFALLCDIPRFKERALWNRFASLEDPAVWDAYVLSTCNVSAEKLATLDLGEQIEACVIAREFDPYREFLKGLGCDSIFAYQMQLVMSTYPGWRVLFYHDIAHALTRSGKIESSGLHRLPIPLLPRAIAELGGRYYQADLHPETEIGDANFLDHPHRGMTTGQTGIIGFGCHLLPCTLGGMSEKVQRRHPQVGNFVSIGTDADLFGPVLVGDHCVIGPNAEVNGLVEIAENCHVGSSVVIGTIKSGDKRPGKIRLEDGVRVGDGTIIENVSELGLVIPEKAEIPARSHVTNDGFGTPRFMRG